MAYRPDMIGVHLMVDGIADRRIGGDDVALILSELPAVIGMKILTGPLVVEGKPVNPGWTGFVIIDNSHISVHTFVAGNEVSINVFSCKAFDEETVLSFLEKHIRFERMATRMLERGAK